MTKGLPSDSQPSTHRPRNPGRIHLACERPPRTRTLGQGAGERSAIGRGNRGQRRGRPTVRPVSRFQTNQAPIPTTENEERISLPSFVAVPSICPITSLICSIVPVLVTRTNGPTPTLRFKLAGTQIALILAGLGSCHIQVACVPMKRRKKK